MATTIIRRRLRDMEADLRTLRRQEMLPLVERVRQDPAETMIAASLMPDPWQAELLRGSWMRALLLCSRQSGKSQVAGALALAEALTRPRSLILLVAQNQRASGELFRDKLLPLWRTLGRPLQDRPPTQLTLELSNGSRTVSLPTSRDRIVFPAGFVKAVEDQWVPLDRDLREALLAIPGHGQKVFCFAERRDDKRKGQILKPTSVGRYITRLAHQAGVKLTMKSPRRGFGCYWASRVPAQVLQKLMRHSNIRITMDYYANVDDAAMQAILGREPLLRNNEAEIGPIRNTSRNSEAGESVTRSQTDSTTPVE